MKKEYYLEGFEDNSEGKLILPSEKKKKKSKLKNNSNENKTNWWRVFKWISIIGFIVVLYLSYNSIILYILEFLKSNPTLYTNYLFVESQISNNTIFGLIMISIMGSLFFLALPSEAILIYYLSSTDYLPIAVIGLVLIGNVIGLSFNYFFGRIIGEKVVKFLFSKNFERYKAKIDKYGGYVILFGNIIPGPIEPLSVFFGAFKFKFSVYIYLSFIGRLIKFIIIFIAFYFFWETLIFHYYQFLDNFLIIKDLFR